VSGKANDPNKKALMRGRFHWGGLGLVAAHGDLRSLRSLVEPGFTTWVLTPSAVRPNKKTLMRGRFYGAADGVRTRDNWNHNPGLYR
jgi:hypothetical protein